MTPKFPKRPMLENGGCSLDTDDVFGSNIAEFPHGRSMRHMNDQPESDKDGFGETTMRLVQPLKSSYGQYRMSGNKHVQSEKLKLADGKKLEKGSFKGRNREGDKKRKIIYLGDYIPLPAKSMVFTSRKEPKMQKIVSYARTIAVLGSNTAVGNATSSSVGAKGSRKEITIVDKQHKLKARLVDGTMKDSGQWKEGSIKKTAPSCSIDRGARNEIRELLRLFQALTRKLFQRQGQGRVDHRALDIFKARGKYSMAEKPIVGRVSGVEVGDEFCYRVELMIVGLHRHLRAGIDYLKDGEMVLASSIVESGGYDNKFDDSDVLIYSGQGGNVTDGDKRPKDQKPERGNIALMNSIDEKNPIRVIRRVNSSNNPKSFTTYTYYGLYTVERYWEEHGQRGNKEFKFELKRLPGQPAPWKEVKDSKECKHRAGHCDDDIAKGKEPVEICAINTVDSEKPPTFTYIAQMRYPKCCNPLPPLGCGCRNGCLNSNYCSCVIKNGREIPYNCDGAIVEAKPLVFECGPYCKCPPSCYNRVSQRGIRFELEIFKTERRGWGVRSRCSIPSGSFICEYTGKLLQEKEAEQRNGNDEYLFDIGRDYKDHSLWEGLRGLIPDAALSSNEAMADAGFTIDAAQEGNVGSFINHSCSPNIFAQNVIYDHDDLRIPHVMFFAAENIPPLQELTYHYNYAIGEVYHRDGSVKVKHCYCGSSNCTGRMY